MQIDETSRLKKKKNLLEYIWTKKVLQMVMMRVTPSRQVLKKDNICESIKLFLYVEWFKLWFAVATNWRKSNTKAGK